MTRSAMLIAALLASSTASANVWQHAIDTGSPDAKRDVYASELQSGDGSPSKPPRKRLLAR